jgi:hypothetical protein
VVFALRIQYSTAAPRTSDTFELQSSLAHAGLKRERTMPQPFIPFQRESPTKVHPEETRGR